MGQKVAIIYSAHARKDLLKLDKPLARKIVLKIEDNAIRNNPLSRAKALSGILSGMYRYRIGNYRVIFRIEKSGQISILMVLRIKHRKDVYR